MAKPVFTLFLVTLGLTAFACAESPNAAEGVDSFSGSVQAAGRTAQTGSDAVQTGSNAVQTGSNAAQPGTDTNSAANPSGGNGSTLGSMGVVDIPSDGSAGSAGILASDSSAPGNMGAGGTATSDNSGGGSNGGASQSSAMAQGGSAVGGSGGANTAANLGGSAGASTVGNGGTPGAGGTNAAGTSSMGGAGDSGESTFHVFLLLGQSNMAGYSRAQSEDKAEDDRIQVLGFDNCSATGRVADQWDVAVPPLHECGPGALGPGDYFAKTLIEQLPQGDTIGLVPCALSGQAVEVFSKGTDKYTWIVDRAKNAQQLGGIIEGLLFHQGESNCGNQSWPSKVQQLVEDLRADLNLGDVPFLAGELPYDSACGNHNPLVNQLPDLISNAHVVSAEGLKLDPADTDWYMHFGRGDQVEFGKRYEAKFVEVMGL